MAQLALLSADLLAMADTLAGSSPLTSAMAARERLTVPNTPTAPVLLKDMDVALTTLIDVVLRRLQTIERSSIVQMGEMIGLAPTVVEGLVQEMRRRDWIELLPAEGRDARFALSGRGRDAALSAIERCRYDGITPVGLNEYTEMIQRQRTRATITSDELAQTFGDLVLGEGLLRSLGPALIGEGAVFLYGPPGTGKTSIAERMIRVYRDAVFVPHAIEVDGAIIRVLDPSLHRMIPGQPPGADPRWVLCERPFVAVGGELTADMLELQYDEVNRTHLPSVQLQANNGLLVIDDFGRQIMSAEELLNRWIVPLERQIDFLRLNTGAKFTVPFNTKVVFATNLEPSELGDEAFLRRIRNKVFVGPLDDREFTWVLARTANAMGVTVTPDVPDLMRAYCRQEGSGELRAYLPRDLCQILISLCTFENLPLELNRDTLAAVANLYWC